MLRMNTLQVSRQFVGKHRDMYQLVLDYSSSDLQDGAVSCCGAFCTTLLTARLHFVLTNA